MSWISDSAAWNFLRPINGYLLDGRRTLGSSNLPGEDSQATLCVSEDNIPQEEQEPPSSQTLIDPSISLTTATKRKSSPVWDAESSRRPRKTVRMAGFDQDRNCILSSTPVTKQPTKRERRAKTTPYLDLRKVNAPKKLSSLEYEALDETGSRKIAAASYDLRQAMEKSNTRVSVATALGILCDVPTDNAVQFVPGLRHKGKEFRCKFKASQDTKVRD
ncbi:hypothetical protein EVJ58_g1527 [Rhodofomes roseus]|nr:hypothetical protein EVJ58_g1527 [Rhodofomes roseus]